MYIFSLQRLHLFLNAMLDATDSNSAFLRHVWFVFYGRYNSRRQSLIVRALTMFYLAIEVQKV